MLVLFDKRIAYVYQTYRNSYGLHVYISEGRYIML